MMAQVISTILHVFWCYLFVSVMELDVEGLGYAMSITALTQFMFTQCYACCVSSIRGAIQLPNAQSFQGWCQYLNLGIPLVLMQCSDWWAFEILTLISGLIGVVDQATFTIIANICVQIFMVPVGLREAACVVVGNSIGENNSMLGWRYYKLITAITLFYCTVFSIILIVLREQIAAIYTNEQSVLALLEKTLPLVGMKYIMDGY